MKIKKLLSLALAAVASFSVFASGCDEEKTETFASVDPIQKATYEGTHIFRSTDTDKDLVKNGASEYVVITPKNPSLELQTAKSEFVYLFKKATGVELRTLTDTGSLTYDENVKYISIGKTSLLKSAEIEIDTLTLGMDGYRVQTKGNSVFLYGGSDNGTVYAVYGFMTETFHFEAYWKDCIQIDTGVTNLKLKNYDITDIPDIAHRAQHYGFYNDTSSSYDARNWSSRIKIRSGMNDSLLTMHSEYDSPNSSAKSIHNSLICLPKATYAQDHPEWYSTAGNQLCYTARGDADEYKAMTEEVAKKVENSLKLYTPDKYPTKNTITVSMEDNTQCCACDKCLELKEKYTSEAGAVCIFMNRVGELVEEWMNDPANAAYKREDFHIIFFAYNNFNLAPSLYDEAKKEWKAVDEKVILRENVGIYFADIQNTDVQQGIYEEINNKGRENLTAWKALTDYVYIWNYSTNFTAYMYYFDSFSFHNADAYAFYASRGAAFYYNQAQWNQTGAGTAWNSLKAWLDAKLLWDCSLDEQVLINQWFKAMYKEAAPIMMTWFNEVRAHCAKVYKEDNLYITGSIYNKVDNEKFFPLGTTMAWMDRCEQAIVAVEKYKTIAPETYENIVGHIEMEWISPAFIALRLHPTSLMTAQRTEMIYRFKRIVSTLGMTLQQDATGGGDLANAFDHLL